jgi:hypothetical protein
VFFIKKEDCNIFADDALLSPSFILLVVHRLVLHDSGIVPFVLGTITLDSSSTTLGMFFIVFPVLSDSKNKYEAAKNRLLSGSKYRN